MKQIKEKKLHLGCGSHFLEDYLNVDGSWGARFAKYGFFRKFLEKTHLVPSSDIEINWDSRIFIHDFKKPLPLKSDVFSVIYSSHLLEHLYPGEVKKLLQECFRVLQPSGVIRVMVPDLKRIIREYEEDKKIKERSKLAADFFVEKLGFRDKASIKGSFLYKLYSLYKDFHTHKWMYDNDSLINYLMEAGFIDVKEMPRHQSRIEDIVAVEKNYGLCVEGIKEISLGVGKKNSK